MTLFWAFGPIWGNVVASCMTHTNLIFTLALHYCYVFNINHSLINVLPVLCVLGYLLKWYSLFIEICFLWCQSKSIACYTWNINHCWWLIRVSWPHTQHRILVFIQDNTNTLQQMLSVSFGTYNNKLFTHVWWVSGLGHVFKWHS